jgi:hypothetical protein
MLFGLGRTAVMATWLVVAMPAPSVADDAAPTPTGRFSAEQAADLAAKLANDECERRYERRPFSPSDYPVEFVGDRFTWGRLDPAGEGGFSAEVSFGPSGGDGEVKCYFSSDKDLPKALDFNP